MKVSQVEQEQSQVVLSIEVDPSEVEEHLDGAYKRVVQRTNIPGFRKGKAPRTVVERFVGRDALLDQALDSLLPNVTARAIQEQDLDVVATPQVKLAQQEPLIIEAIVAVRPPVDLGEYREMRLEPEAVEVTQEQVEEVVESLRQRMGTWEPVERAVGLDDMVAMDVRGEADGESIVDQSGIDYVVTADSPSPLPGFAERLVGAAIAEQLGFPLPFPDDYPNAELAGKECQFTVTVSEVKERKLPEVNDDFANSLELEVESVDALRERLDGNLRQQAQANADRQFEELLVQTLVEGARVELPPLMVEHEVEHILGEQVEALSRFQVNMETYLSNMGKTAEQLREEAWPRAVERLTRSMVLQELVKTENIQVTPEEVEEQLGSQAEGSGDGEESMRRIAESEEGRQYLNNVLLTRRTFERLIQIAKGDAVDEAAPVDQAPAEGAAEDVDTAEEAPTEEGQTEPKGGE